MHAMRGRFSWDWRSLPGRVAGSGLAGAALGAAIAGIWYASWTSDLGCPKPTPGSVDGNFCLPLGLWLLAIAVNCVVIIAGVWGAFTLLRLRPRWATVPGGCVVMVLMIFVSAGELGPPLRIKSPPALWLTALEAGAGLAAFALVAGGRRVWLAGVLALAVVAAASVKVPPLVRQHQLADTRLHQFTALGFPLEAPSVPGYHLSAASPSDGVLLDVIDPTAPQGPSEISVTIGPVASSWAAQQRALCTGGNTLNGGPLFDCSVIRPGVWLWANSTIGNEVMAEHAGLMVIAGTDSQPSTVSEATLITAATSLRTTTAATLAGLPG